MGGVLGLLGLVAKPAQAKPAQAIPKEKSGRFLIVVHQAVGNLPPQKAEALCERVGDKMKKQKPDDCLSFIIIPQRAYETWIEVFPLGGQEPSKSIEAFVYDFGE